MVEEGRNISVKGDSKTSICPVTEELSEYLKLCIKNILNQVDVETFVFIYKKCYKEFKKTDEVVRPSLSGSSSEGKKYQMQFNDIIMKSTYKTIDETVLNMNNKLKELQELKSSQLGCSIHWRPPGNAYQHMIPFEYMSEMEKKKEMESKIEREHEALSILKSRLSQKRIKAEELNKLLLSLIDEIKTLVTIKINEEQLQQAI